MNTNRFTLEAAALVGVTSADAVERLNTFEPEDAAILLAVLPLHQAVEILEQPELHHAPEIIRAMPTLSAVRLLNEAASDCVTDLFQEFDETTRARLMSGLDNKVRVVIRKLLSYPDGTAGALMTTEFVSVTSEWTVGETLDFVRRVQGERETVYAIYVLDPEDGTLQSVVTLRRLITGKLDDPVLSVAQTDTLVTVTPMTDQEEVAREIRRHNMLALPVIDESRHILGIVTVDDVIDAMIEESTEDALKFGGMETPDNPYMKISFLDMIRKRGGWLAALFIGEMLTASAMQHYEVQLEKAIVLTLFIPLIMSSGGNSGSQATSLLIRSLALQEVRLADWWRVALREIPTGLTLGFILGVVGIARIVIWQKAGFYDYGDHWMLVALTVGLTLVGIVTFGSLVGSMLPFLLQRLGLDPASASAPFVATLVDVTGLVIYFSVAVMVLSGTLL